MPKEIEIKPNNANYEIFNSMLLLERPESQKKKHFWVMGSNDKNVMLCIYLVGVGNQNIRDYSVSDILAGAVRSNANKIVIATNYPNSKDRKPTEEDIDGTNWLYHASKILGITLEDHIIIFNEI